MVGRRELQIRWPFRRLWRHPHLDAVVAKLGLEGGAVAAGWGYRPSGNSARQVAAAGGGRLLLLEDAFVRSMKPGAGREYGLVADSRGIYYDASGSSDLIEALETGTASGWMGQERHPDEEIHGLLGRFRTSMASKYNWYPGDFGGAPEPDEPGVMVVDQTRGDTSIAKGGLKEADFERMVRDALDEHPAETIYLRAHPDHRYRGKHSCFPEWVFAEKRIRLLPPDWSPARCFRFCRVVYAGTSLMGMEGLIHGCKVRTYGWNFYAGWGLTEDRCTGERRPRPHAVSLARLFEAAYLQYGHYFDPDSGEPCGLGRILDHIELQREMASRHHGLRVTVGWAPWKRTLADGFFRLPGCELRHADSGPQAMAECAGRSDARLLLWGGTDEPAGNTLPVSRVEDGFLRSSGLGATFHRPLSWVCDEAGIYFDPRTPSRLERLLEAADFSDAQLAGAEELLAFLKKHRLTKYNLAGRSLGWTRAQAGGKKVILVPGQVEADASIRHGSPDLKSNGDLIRRVRAAEPEAYLIFKAHPDLVAGARHGALVPSEAEGQADLTVTHGNVLDWMELCDEVHTMTSTVGFEAILRGVPVVTYGLPFYAGWGLTRDHLDCPRRTRRLTVPELVCGALIAYPCYLNPLSGEFTTAMRIARLLSAGGPVGERRAWYLRIVSILKQGWVRLARAGGGA